MSRTHRLVLLGCIAAAFVFLLVHVCEPIRLNVGDPWSEANVLSSIKYVKHDGFLATSFTDILDVGPLTVDSYRYTHYPPFSEIIYGALGKTFGFEDISVYRLFALAFSGLGLRFLYLYLRRMFDDGIALIATALWCTNLLWLSYADMMHQAPVLQATAFIGLWGLVRALETDRVGHHAAALLGCAAAFFTSYDYLVFLPVAVMVTIALRRGNPFRTGNRRFLVICAAGCLVGIVLKFLCVIGAVGWREFVADLHFQFLERSGSTFEKQFTAALPTMTRRFSLVFSPMFWLVAGYFAIKAVRAPSLRVVVRDPVMWFLLSAIVFLRVFAQLAASQMLPTQVMLPFYAVGGAVLLDRLLAGSRRAKIAAQVAFVIAVAWTGVLAVTFERSFLERDDVAKVNVELAAHDHNDFVLSNLLSAGHIQAFFERHYFDAFAGEVDVTSTLWNMLATFEQTGATSLYGIIFTTPESRFIDKSIWPIALPREKWSTTGWPNLFTAKTNAMINAYDKPLIENLATVGASRVMRLSNFDLYHLDRKTVMDRIAARVPLVDRIDFSGIDSARNKLFGWSSPEWTKDRTRVVSSVTGFAGCMSPPHADGGNACPTKLTKRGMEYTHQMSQWSAGLMIRVERKCNVALTIHFAPTPSRLGVEIGAFSYIPATDAAEELVVIPASEIEPGVDVIALQMIDRATGLARAASPMHIYQEGELVPPRHEVGVSQIDVSPRCE